MRISLYKAIVSMSGLLVLAALMLNAVDAQEQKNRFADLVPPEKTVQDFLREVAKANYPGIGPIGRYQITIDSEGAFVWRVDTTSGFVSMCHMVDMSNKPLCSPWTHF